MNNVSYLLISLVCLSVLLSFLTYWLFRLYGEKRERANWMGNLDFLPGELSGFRYSSLIVVSVLSLFLEMMMIRWISSEIRVFAYFKNLVLVACFLGFGLGCYLCRQRVRLVAMVAPLLVLTIGLKAPLSPVRRVTAELPYLLGGTDVHIWGVPSLPTNWLATVLALAVMVPLFAMIAIVFVPVGQLVGWYLEQSSDGVTAYSVNVLASLAGIIAFSLLCFINQPPALWMLVAGTLAVITFWDKRQVRWILAACFLVCVLLLSIPDHKQVKTYWSPYQKLDLQSNYEEGSITSYTLNTNDSWYQRIVDLSPEFIKAHPEDFRELAPEWRAYNIPYQFYPAPPSVLILGSGMGNNVAAALRNGAERVVAVEIDPLILKLGAELHFEHPYQSPRTHVVLDDARSYIENSHEQFDLIVFSLLDSHTTASDFSNIRIDNYVYTREALARVRQLLKTDGLLIIEFQVNTPWIAGRLYNLLKNTFGEEPVQFQIDTWRYDTGGHFFIGGSQQRIRQAMSNSALASFVRTHPGMPSEGAPLTTDDWPYFYQHQRGLPFSIVLVTIAVLLTVGWFLRQTSPAAGNVDLHFFLLGAAFMLLEAQIVSRMALLFGTTWVVNSIVVSGLLCLILAANILYRRFPRVPVRWAYAGLFTSLLISLTVPLEKLFFESILIRTAISTVVLCMPVFFAGIVFISSFAKANFQGESLGSNLFGALAGGLFESISLWFGLKALIVLAALIYAGSALAPVRRMRTSAS